MTLHTFTMTEEQARLIHEMAADRMAAHKNWTASAVESGKFEYAQELVAKLRKHEDIFAAFNMTAKHEIAQHTGKALETSHVVKERR